MKEAGELFHNPDAPVDAETLDADFWIEAELQQPKAPPRSVHLKLEPEVFAFFKRQGKGHLTKMQNVLTAFVRSRAGK